MCNLTHVAQCMRVCACACVRFLQWCVYAGMSDVCLCYKCLLHCLQNFSLTNCSGLALETHSVGLLAMAVNVLAAPGPTYDEDLVLYAAVSEESVVRLHGGESIPNSATGRTWIAFRGDLDSARERSTWFTDGSGNETNCIIGVRFTPLGVSNLVRARILAPAPVDGSWRFYGHLPAAMTDANGHELLSAVELHSN